jgi:Pyruvate/2-oxoacid:ferredoxin oxidoreductase delta subunit
MPVLRKIIQIDESKCDGCGDCVPFCAEGAIQIIDGKAKLVSESLCDGFGACLGTCPKDAITIEEREALPFDETQAGGENHHSQSSMAKPPIPMACPGSLSRTLTQERKPSTAGSLAPRKSYLGNWPVQLKLVSPSAPFLKGASLLVCADCVPFASPDFHERYLDGRVLLVGCPKLDDLEFYFEKLKMIFASSKPRDITVIRMEVPCCYGIVKAVEAARDATSAEIQLNTITIGINGEIIE